MKRNGKFGFLFLGAALMMGISLTLVNGSARGAAPKGTPFMPKIPLGLDSDSFYVPPDNPLTKEKIALGRLLFFDKRLSGNGTIACATCHIPALAFTDGQPVSSGIHHQQGGRSAPMAINRAFSKAQFWDGRAASVEDQALGPFINPIEHGFMSHDQMVKKMKGIKGYREEFKEVFGGDIKIEDVGKAIASFERTLLSGNSPFDQYESGDEENAISEAAQRGLELFRNKARCTKCHSGFNFTDEKFHNLGIGWDGSMVDLGRYAVTKNEGDIGAFKTPSLREISRTAPYMHDGRFPNLEAVVDFYNQGGIKNPHQDPLIIPLNLTPQEKSDLVEFLHTLNGEGWKGIEPPTEFPM
jgi:cytochrome c peroxidase